MTPESYLSRVQTQCSTNWSHIARCAESTSVERARLRDALHREVPADTAFVAFGSLARAEWTEASDLDWALLVDGQTECS